MIAEEIQTAALVTDWSKVKAEHPAPGIKRQMVVGQNVMMVRFTFDPFLVTAEHTHPHEQMTLVLNAASNSPSVARNTLSRPVTCCISRRITATARRCLTKRSS